MQSVLAHPDFQDGKVTTRWVETKFNWKLAEPSFEALIAAAIEDTTSAKRKTKNANRNEPDPYNPWKNGSGFRN
jgi:acetyl/propionyl-CoA carboxylase alpha subunit